jgi:hypothetical protein
MQVLMRQNDTGMMSLVRPTLTRRQILLATAGATHIGAAEEGFWNTKPPAQWTAGDIYQLMNRSPWATSVQAWGWDESGQQTQGPECVVTWESASPVRDALKSPLPFYFEHSYVIGVDGLSHGKLGSLNSLKPLTILHTNSKRSRAVHPNVADELVRNSAICAFGFPHSTGAVDVDANEVTFETRIGIWMLQAKFNLKKMLYHGRLAV